MITDTVKTSHGFHASLGDAFDCTAGADLPPTVEIFFWTEQIPVGCCYWDIDGAGTIDRIALAQTDETGSLSTKVTVCVCI